MRVIWGPQTILCPEMFSINLALKENKNAVFFSCAETEKRQVGLLVRGLEPH